MATALLDYSHPFLSATKKKTVPVIVLTAKSFPAWLKKQKQAVQGAVAQNGFKAAPGQTMFVWGTKGDVETVLTGVNERLQHYDLAATAAALRQGLSAKALKGAVFRLEGVKAGDDETRAALGWGLSSYRFTRYKKKPETETVDPVLLWPEKADRKVVEAQLEGVFLIRNLVNTPSNDMGPEDLESAAAQLADKYGAKARAIVDGNLKRQNFPLIYTVGDSSPRRPRLIDITWGKPSHPKVTIVGKGVCFDTGGLDIKPPQYMLLMKKDMGGAAHALGVALMVMKAKLPVRLRVLVPAVENSTDGNSFRPRDVSKSRKGLSVELSDTDAEGRLILADAITYACEEEPDLLIDLATLTGSARVALGYDIPALFSNRDKIAEELKTVAAGVEDYLWPLPLFDGYRKELDSDVADINNIGSGAAGAIHAGLFLREFITGDPDWIHLDMYAWEQNGKPGRPRGGADTGARAVFAYLQKRFGA